MSRKFEVWLNSGANIHSCYKVTTSLDELSITSEEWEAMDEEEKEGVMRDIAFGMSDWGFKEIS